MIAFGTRRLNADPKGEGSGFGEEDITKVTGLEALGKFRQIGGDGVLCVSVCQPCYSVGVLRRKKLGFPQKIWKTSFLENTFL